MQTFDDGRLRRETRTSTDASSCPDQPKRAVDLRQLCNLAESPENAVSSGSCSVIPASLPSV